MLQSDDEALPMSPSPPEMRRRLSPDTSTYVSPEHSRRNTRGSCKKRRSARRPGNTNVGLEGVPYVHPPDALRRLLSVGAPRPDGMGSGQLPGEHHRSGDTSSAGKGARGWALFDPRESHPSIGQYMDARWVIEAGDVALAVLEHLHRRWERIRQTEDCEIDLLGLLS